MIRTGAEYVEALRKPREVYVGGEKVTQVLDYAPFRRPIESYAALYDLKHDPAAQEHLTVRDENGELSDISFLVPKSQEQLLPAIDLFNRCQLNVILPTGDTRINDGAFSTGLRNYQEFFQTTVGLAGESQNFDGNGSYTRFMSGGGAFPVQTDVVQGQTDGRNPAPLFGSATSPPVGTRPARGGKPPYKPNAPCYKQKPPNLDSAKIGAGP